MLHKLTLLKVIVALFTLCCVHYLFISSLDIKLCGVVSLKNVVVSHSDVDGVVSAALIHRISKDVKVIGCYLSSIRALTRSLNLAVNNVLVNGASHLIISDLNIASTNQLQVVKSILSKLTGIGVEVYWFDHHRWFEKYIKELEEIGVYMHIDENLVAAEIIAKYFNINDPYSLKLVELAVDDDRFINENPLSTKWRRVLRWYDWSFRRKAVKALAEGDIWPKWADEAYKAIEEQYNNMLKKIVEELKVVNINEYRTAIIFNVPGKIHPGDIHLELLSRGLEADIYILVYSGGTSFRSKVIDVALLAQKLGGNGHTHSAGAPVKFTSIEEVKNTLSKILPPKH